MTLAGTGADPGKTCGLSANSGGSIQNLLNLVK
jgi:hypothetical protein